MPSVLCCRDIFADVLMHDGFLIPTAEQLESLDIDPSGTNTQHFVYKAVICWHKFNLPLSISLSVEDSVDKFAPCLPRVFLHFWLPCLKVLNSSIFINLILDKLFAELSNEPSSHRTYYIASWISEILLCNSKSMNLGCPLGACDSIYSYSEKVFGHLSHTKSECSVNFKTLLSLRYPNFSPFYSDYKSI